MTSRITGGDGFRLANRSKDGREVVIMTGPMTWGVEGPEGPTFITVPDGFESDFASVPWAARRLVPSFGPWAKAAVLHDYLYVTRGEDGKWTRKQADDMFLEAMEAIAATRPDGQPDRLKRAMIHRAVRAFGAGGWGS
jgi:hypothetical protein